MGFVFKAQKDWPVVGRFQVAVHRNVTYSSYYYFFKADWYFIPRGLEISKV